MQKSVRLVFLVAAWLAWTSSRPVVAWGAPAEANPDSALAQTLASLAGDPLTLAAARNLARAQATDLRSAEAALRAAQGSRQSESGSFEPELFADLTRSKSETPAASPFAGGSILRPETTAGSAGIRWSLPIGTELSASFGGTRTSTNSTFAALNPQYDGSARLDLTQPLLKGAGPSAWAELAAANRGVEAAEAALDDARLATEAAVDGAYWELYAAERDLAVQRLVRDRARSIRDEAGARAAVGLVGPGQVANAKVFLAEQEQAVLDAEDRLDGLSDALAALIGRRPAGNVRFHASDDPPQAFPVAPADTLVAQAFRQNPLLRALDRQAAALEARARGASWDALPAVDFVASLGGNALAGTPRDIIFGGDTLRVDEKGGWSDLVSEALARDHPSWSAGLRVTMPLTLRSGRGDRLRARAEAAQAREAVEAARRATEQQVRALWRELDKSDARRALAKDGVDASFDQVRIGVLEYRAGRTTAFELVRLGADLATAQQRYSQALVRTARAAAELNRMTGGSMVTDGTRSGQ